MNNNAPVVSGVAAAMAMSVFALPAAARSPCGGLGECKALVEINSSDGDIGFHFLMDGDELSSARVKNPEGKNIFKTEALRELDEQTYTELFVESAEPLCFDPLTDEDPENDEEDFRTLADFLELWSEGDYRFVGFSGVERASGKTALGFDLPAAPADLNYNDNFGTITWEPGTDLGECATEMELDDMVMGGDLPTHPRDVAVKYWEIVFEADVESDHPADGLKMSIRVPGDIEVRKVKVPPQFLDAMPDDTPAKYEIGAIGWGDNATFTEEGDICVNEVSGCEEEE